MIETLVLFSIFISIDIARIVIPITEYQDVIERHHVDMFLYANNYDDAGDSLSFFDNIDDALKTFRAGSFLPYSSVSLSSGNTFNSLSPVKYFKIATAASLGPYGGFIIR